MDYLRRRLEAAGGVIAFTDSTLRSAVRRIVDIAYRYNIEPSLFRFSTNRNMEKEIDAVLATVREMLFERMVDTVTFADPDDDEDSWLPLLSLGYKDKKGNTIKDKIAIYTDRFKYEVEAGIAAALLADVSADKCYNAIRNNIQHPYSNPYFLDKSGQGKAIRLEKGGAHYGRGHSNVARNLLAALLGDIVAKGFMEYFAFMGRRDGAIGYVVQRGSSYPCEICDDAVSAGLRPLDDMVIPLHPNCRCWALLVYYL